MSACNTPLTTVKEQALFFEQLTNYSPAYEGCILLSCHPEVVNLRTATRSACRTLNNLRTQLFSSFLLNYEHVKTSRNARGNPGGTSTVPNEQRRSQPSSAPALTRVQAPEAVAQRAAQGHGEGPRHRADQLMELRAVRCLALRGIGKPMNAGLLEALSERVPTCYPACSKKGPDV